MILKMLCGTPVIGFNRGSVPEIITDQKTGFVVDNIEEMMRAVMKINNLSRKECHISSVSRFNSNIMVGAYESVFTKQVNIMSPQFNIKNGSLSGDMM